ncbi:hypothetical protein DCAR_0314277 [Daucus carota subsp. sativus]|uniref:Uncharacterized protein n=1 Tax=Daucus carota subsp. sativus TaxID=79200 RepID=A0A161Y3P6_DAUCS|nr:hypothetical protein DCAR_0314277 [Daucus carota subsp. sativus]
MRCQSITRYCRNRIKNYIGRSGKMGFNAGLLLLSFRSALLWSVFRTETVIGFGTDTSIYMDQCKAPDYHTLGFCSAFYDKILTSNIGAPNPNLATLAVEL